MKYLEEDLAFSFPFIRRLQEIGIRAMEVAQETAMEEEQSMVRLREAISQAPPRANVGGLEELLDQYQGTMVLPCYEETKIFLRDRLNRLIENITQIDYEGVLAIQELSARRRRLQWQYDMVIQMIGKGSVMLSRQEFAARVERVLQLGEQEDVWRYLSVKDGRFVYHWSEISAMIRKKELTEQDLLGLLEVLKQMGTEPNVRRQGVYENFIMACQIQDSEGIYLFSPHVKELLELYQKTLEPELYEAFLKELLSCGKIHVSTKLDPMSYQSQQLDRWIQWDYQMGEMDIAQAKTQLERYWGKGTEYETYGPNHFNVLRKAAKNMTDEEFVVYQKHMILAYKCNSISSFTSSFADSVKYYSLLSDHFTEDYIESQGKEFNRDLKYRNLAKIVQNQSSVAAKWGSGTGRILNSVVSVRLIQEGGALVSKAGLGSALGTGSGVPLIGTVRVTEIGIQKEVVFGTLADILSMTIPKGYEDYQEGLSLKEIAKRTPMEVAEHAAWNMAGAIVVRGVAEGISQLKKVTSPYLDDVMKVFRKNGDDVLGSAGAIEGAGQSLTHDDIRYQEYWNQKELLSKSNCSDEVLYEYLYKIDPEKAINYSKTGQWPSDVQIPKNTSVLNNNWGIDWAQVPKGGYVLDSNGNPIKELYTPEIGDVIDRYGPANGRYTSPVSGSPYDYDSRALPYVDDPKMYHQYEVVGDFSDIKSYVDSCNNVDLVADIEDYVNTYYGGDYNKLVPQIGDIANGFGTTSGGTQIELPMPVDMLESLGILKEVH